MEREHNGGVCKHRENVVTLTYVETTHWGFRSVGSATHEVLSLLNALGLMPEK